MDNLSYRIAEKMSDFYGEYLTRDDCAAISLDVIDAMTVPELKIAVTEWLNGATSFIDYDVNNFVLEKVARQLNPTHPNIPVAALLLYLESLPGKMGEPNPYKGLPALAAEPCSAETRVISDGKPCRLAISYQGQWAFFMDGNHPVGLRTYQMWQVLLLNPKLIPVVALGIEMRMAAILQEDGRYMVIDDPDFFE